MAHAPMILDATLREGEQTPGVCFDGHIKLAIADLLAAVGVDIVEAGHPAVADDIALSVEQIARRGLPVTVGAHARSLERDVDQALERGVGFLGIFYCVSDERLGSVARSTLASAIDQVSRVIAYAKRHDPKLLVRYTPEDTVRSRFANVVEAAAAAVEAGADIISVADTTGFMVPGTERSMYDFVLRLREALAARELVPKIAVHCHNDRGLALANALDAFRAGAEVIDATVLGLGERAGIVDLAQLLVVLRSDFGVDRGWDLARLGELYRLVSRHAGVQVAPNLPVMGENAFTHCAGVHTHAATINPLHYQSLDPALVGREMEICLDHMSGAASVRYALDHIGEDADDADLVKLVLRQVKSVGQRGRRVRDEELRHIVRWCRSEVDGGRDAMGLAG